MRREPCQRARLSSDRFLLAVRGMRHGKANSKRGTLPSVFLKYGRISRGTSEVLYLETSAPPLVEFGVDGA